MRIGIEAQRIFRKKKHGMDIVVLEIVKQLQKLDSPHQFVVFVKDDEDRICLQESENTEIVTVPGKTYVDWEQWHLPKAARAHNLDLLHCTSNTAPLNIKVPTLITVHDIIYLEKLQFTGTAYQNFGNIYRRFNVPKVSKKAKKIITVSNYEKKRILEKMELPENQVDVVYNGISEIFRQYGPSELARFKKDKNLPDRYILSLGNKAPKKNMKGSIKAYLDYRAKSKDPMPMVLVECDDDFLHKTLSELGASKDREYFILTGYLPHAQLPYLYNLSTLFLYPSFRESFGIPILEGNACGVPVITSNTSSMPEVANGSAYLTDPYHTSSITEALLRLESDGPLRHELVNKGLQNSANFTWRNSAMQTLEIYESLLKA